MKKKLNIRKIDSDIFSTLHNAKRPLPVKKIAERIDVSWPTANLSVKKLRDMKVLRIKKTVRMSKVDIDPIFLKKWEKELYA